MVKKDVAAFFDSYADRFDAIYGNRNLFPDNIINRYFRKSMRLRFISTMEGCCPVEGKTVADIGCGPGHYSVALAKKGARFVYGIDFANGMIDLARQNAKKDGVEDRCRFICADFLTYTFNDTVDYSVVMGFMDYCGKPREMIAKVLSITRSKALFSFPKAGGILAWQRRLRYKGRCDLFLYSAEQLKDIFSGIRCKKTELKSLGRDFFVTVAI